MPTPHADETEWERDVQHLLVHGRDLEAAEIAVRNLHETQGRPPTQDRGARTMEPLEQLDELGGVLGDVAGSIGIDQLDAPTPCAGFGVRDVLGHMIGGATHFAAAFRGEQAPEPSEDLAAGPDVVARAGEALGELIGSAHVDGALDRTIASPFGDVSGETFVRYLIVDGLVHGWDISTAIGRPYAPPDALVAEADAFARTFITSELRDGDTFADATEAPAGASPIERLAAFTGRAV